MSHDFHERLPGFDPGQILVDGCRECEARSKRNDRGISSLGVERFGAAWLRAREWQRKGLSTVSAAELPLLDALWSVQCLQSLTDSLARNWSVTMTGTVTPEQQARWYAALAPEDPPPPTR